jgi:cytochrome c biogenesis protein CcdA
LSVESEDGFQYKGDVSNKHVRKSRKKRKFRASRSFRFLLLSLGLTSLVIGCGLLPYGHMGGNDRVKLFALLYLGLAVVTLGLRQVIILRHERAKRREIRIRKRSPDQRSAVKRPKLNGAG